ncbi:MAG: site-specific integrase, partial [Oscillospiraceae bacterium]|nr:site-specific integrase [Oscillospiraceae bacterium]
KQSEKTTQKCGLTVKELFEMWLCHIRHKIKDSSYANYLMKLELHIYPAFGDLKFESITHKSIDGFINEKLSVGRIKGGKLSEKYVSDMVMLLKSLGKFAERQYNYENPLRNISAPKTQHKELLVPPMHEQRSLINYLLRNPSARNLGILLCLYTGIRLGELCAMKWSDVDFDERVLRVNKTAQRIKRFDGDKSTELIISTPKSARSNREIPLQGFLLSILAKYQQSSDSYLLSGTDKAVEPRLMQYYFNTILKKANLPSFNFHTCRHIFATNCIAAGFDIKTLSEILGHSTVELTLNRYVHSSKERKRECMELLKLVS